MRISSFNIAVMMLMLAIGIAAGALMFRGVPNTNAASDRQFALNAQRPSPAALSSKPSSQETNLATYVGVVFARQSADIVARSEGTLQAVYVNLGDRLKTGDIIAQTDSYSNTQQLQIAEATLLSAQADQRDAELEL